MDMELAQLYESIDRLKEKGVVVNAYGGSGNPYDPDDAVLGEFMEYIYVSHPKDRPDWLEAFYQVLNWQYQAFYEGVATFYEDSYGLSPYGLQVKTVDFLEKQGYPEIAELFRKGMTPKNQGVYQEIYTWIGERQDEVWRFCLDILEKHRTDWPVQGV